MDIEDGTLKGYIFLHLEGIVKRAGNNGWNRSIMVDNAPSGEL